MVCGKGECGAKEKTFPNEKVGPKRGWGWGKDVDKGRRRSLGKKCVPRKKGLGGKGGGGDGAKEKMYPLKEMGLKKDVPQGKGGQGEGMGSGRGCGLGRNVLEEKVGGEKMCPHGK
jgi:hypothetical protein